jgi:hypothetical protein
MHLVHFFRRKNASLKKCNSMAVENLSILGAVHKNTQLDFAHNCFYEKVKKKSW